MKKSVFFLAPIALISSFGFPTPTSRGISSAAAAPPKAEELRDFDVVIAGGTTAAFAAASMSRNDRTARRALEHIAEIQALVRAKTPIDWTIDGETYPKAGEATPP